MKRCGRLTRRDLESIPVGPDRVASNPLVRSVTSHSSGGSHGTRRVVLAETGAFLVQFARQTSPVLQHCLELIDEEGEPSKGVRCLPTPGHTPGRLAVELSSRGERLLLIGDVVIHPLHVMHPEWYSVFDADPVPVAQTRRAPCARGRRSLSRPRLSFRFPRGVVFRPPALDSRGPAQQEGEPCGSPSCSLALPARST